jgi:hypothetical protein
MSKARAEALICTVVCILLVIALVQIYKAVTFSSKNMTSDVDAPTSAETSTDETAAKQSSDEEAAIKEEEAKKARAEAAEKVRKEREQAIEAFPVKVTEVKIMRDNDNSDNAYVSLTVKNTGESTIGRFLFTYIGYDSFGEPRADADDEIFSYEGEIEPGATLDLISAGYRWQIKDHTSEGWYDDYGAVGDEDGDRGNFDDYYDSDGYTDSYEAPFQTRSIAGVKVSVYRAVSTDGETYSLSVADRPWSNIAYLN